LNLLLRAMDEHPALAEIAQASESRWQKVRIRRRPDQVSEARIRLNGYTQAT